jgi:acyl-coenzyme A thioesterase PaaI-like protein
VSIDIPALIHGASGFVQVLGPRVLSTEPALLRLDAGPELHNHVGGPHAAAIFGLGETAAFVVLLQVFGDLVEAGAVPLVKEAQIGYTAIVTGPMLAAAQLAGGDEDGVRASLEDSLARHGRATFPVEVRFRREQDDVETAVATYRMALLRS